MPTQQKIRPFDGDCAIYDVCEKAALILEHSHSSARAILSAFDLVRSARAPAKGGSVVGTTTDDEQDLLRAMLVMSAAGLDAMTKQLVRDTMPYIVHDNEIARSALESFIGRRLARDFESLQEGRRARNIPAMLASYDLQEQTTNQYVRSLTEGSLQSADELRKIAAAFGLTDQTLKTDLSKLKKIFEIRNEIIHELDINLSAKRRNRNTRSKSAMVRDANLLLAAGEDLLVAVDQQIALCQGEQ